jgi:phosphate transport system substrate-binding protein
MSAPWSAVRLAFVARILAITLLSMVVLVACQPQPLTVTREPVTVRLVAAEACTVPAQALAAAYEEGHPWVTLELTSFTSRLAQEALIGGEADLALLPWLDQETAPGVWSTPVARTGVAIVANPSLPLTGLRLGHLYEMYRGRLQEWEGHVLVVVSREEGSGTRAMFEQAVLRGREMSALTAVMLPSEQSVLDFVAETPDALGYVATVYMSATPSSGVQVVPVDGVLPTRETIADGSYPLWGLLYLAAVGEPAGPSRDFAQWVLSPTGQDIIARFGE